MATIEDVEMAVRTPAVLAPAGAPLGGTGEAPVVLTAAERAERRRQFEREALQHLDALYSFALKLSRARDDAEDLVSDTLLRAFERWEQYRLGTNIRAWLFTILYHVFVSRKRRIDAREVQPHEDGDGGARTRRWARRTPRALLRLLPRRGDHARHRRAPRRVPLGRGAERRAGAALRRDRRGAARAPRGR
jgi:hypothetical protein